MLRTIILDQECEVTKLNQFIGHQVEISISNNITFNYYDFNWEIDFENNLILMDEYEKDCNVYIPMDKINSIKNLTDNLHEDVVTIKYGDNKLDICCAE